MSTRLPMPRPIPVLLGELITLRPIDPAGDAADYFEWDRDPHMHVWTRNVAPASLADGRAELERYAAMSDATMWAIADAATGRMIGRFFVCLYEHDGRLVAGDGNRLARAFWRTGRTREARLLAYGYAFDVLKADCIESECWADNVNSRSSIVDFGFQPAGERTEYDAKRDRQASVSMFQLDKDRWHELQRLSGRGHGE